MLHDVGLAYVSYVPAVPAAQVGDVAGPSLPDAVLVMANLPRGVTRLQSARDAGVPDGCAEHWLPVEELRSALGRSSLTAGDIGYAYREIGGQAPQIDPTDVLWTDLVPLQDWTSPRQEIVCTMGIFNPMGPTVSSLELAWNVQENELVCTLFYVLRHPHLPRIDELGTVSPKDLPQLIEAYLAGDGDKAALRT